jgi:amino acid adenylation domain-containing protein/non-ribosomal peptide synthase protein (TIGR01720 family)
VVARHEILRTTFHRLPGMDLPLQVVGEAHGPALSEHDLSRVGDGERAEAVEALFRQSWQTPFDLERPPQLRASLATLSPQERVLLLALPALCADRATLDILVGEVARAYESGVRGGSPEEELTQYADVAEIFNDLLESDDTRAGRDYWRRQDVAGLLGINLPFAREGEGAAVFDPQSASVTLPPELLARLDEAAAACGTSTPVFALACWQIQLWRLTGQPEFVVGMAFDGRTYEGLDEALGVFAKHVPVRCRLGEGVTLGEAVAQAHEAASGASKRQEYFTWDDVVAAPGGQGPACFGACFEFDEQPPARQAGGVTFAVRRRHVCAEQFKVKLCCTRGPEGLRVELYYDADVLDADSARRMAGQFETLLREAVARPRAGVAELEMVGGAERREVLVEFAHGARVERRVDECLHGLFEEQAERTPDAAAVVSEQGSLTYSELDAASDRLALRLSRLGVGLDSRVAISAERGLAMVVGVLGVLKAGGAYLPLDPSYPKERLAFMLDDARAEVLLAERRLAGQLPAHGARLLYLDDEADESPEEGAGRPGRVAAGDAAAYVIYTSGSTGKPKGVVVSHRAICNHMRWLQSLYPLAEGDRVLQRAPFSFDASVWEIFAPLISGACLVLARPADHKDPSALTETMAAHGVTVLQLVPSMLKVLLEEPGLKNCASLRGVFCGGERLPAELQENFFSLMAADLHNLYGPTEASINATAWECRRDSGERVVPIGRPAANTQIYLLGADLRPVPVGVPGALHIGGAGLARGYLNRPGLTAERFIPDPFSTEPGARLYRTGDLARFRPGGEIEFLGRADDQVKIRGFRIELGEVESMLATYPSVKAGVVVAREDVPGEKRLVAYVVFNQGWEVSVGELRRFLIENLPEYMVPTAFVVLGALPLMPNGKIDRKALPAPEAQRPTGGEAFVAPLTPTEKLLAQVWSQVLGVERVGVHDNFFDLGGDSILAIRVAARSNQAGLHLTPRQLFQSQTIAELASAAGVAPEARAEAEAMTGAVPLSPIQSRFFRLGQPDPHHFNQSVLLRVRQPLNEAVLRRALVHLMAHHDALNLRFTEGESGWRQEAAAPGEEAPFVRVDMSAYAESPEGERAAALDAAAGELQAGFSLAEGPLLRVALFDFGPGLECRLLIIVHHLAVDIVSWGVLLEDLQTAYQQLSRGEAVRLPPRTTSFKEWAERLAAWAQSDELRRELDYWLAEPRRKAASLPVDYHGGANTVESAGTVSVSLGPEDTRALLREVPRAYHTQIHEVLLTALGRAFEGWTGSPSLLVDVEGHGREEIFDDVDLSRTVGWFTAVYPLLIDLGGAAGPGEALKAVKEEVRRVPRGGLGYGVLRYVSEDSQASAALEAMPQAGVIFNHMGQFDQVIDESAPFAPAKEPSGRTHSARRSRDHLLEINGGVSDGRLQTFWLYSENVHRRDTVEGVALRFVEELKALIAHCLSPEAGTYTPSDFPQANLDDEKLSRILSTVKFGE